MGSGLGFWYQGRASLECISVINPVIVVSAASRWQMAPLSSLMCTACRRPIILGCWFRQRCFLLHIVSYMQDASAAVVRVLLAASSDHTLQAADGDSPLLIAVRTNNTLGVKALLGRC